MHAEIHPDIPRIANLGFLVNESVYHPGDSFDVPEGARVETLFVPVSAPWLKISESVDFVRAVAPRRAFALHDGIINDAGGNAGRRRPRPPAQGRLPAPGARVRASMPDPVAELYTAPPDGFVAARDELVAEAKAAGQTDRAKQLGKLRKPTVAAWVVNLLAIRRPELVDQLVELSAALRSAQRELKGDALRELTKQRREAVGALVKEARRAGHEGRPAQPRQAAGGRGGGDPDRRRLRRRGGRAGALRPAGAGGQLRRVRRGAAPAAAAGHRRAARAGAGEETGRPRLEAGGRGASAPPGAGPPTGS